MSELEIIQKETKAKLDAIQIEFSNRVKDLQESCLHPTISPWLIRLDAHNIVTTLCVKLCEICGAVIDQKDYRLITVDQLPYDYQPGPVQRIADKYLEDGDIHDINDGVRKYYEDLK